MRKIINILKWYKDEPWWAIPRDIFWGIRLGISLSIQLLKEDKKKQSNE
jgi:hypothetical protein